MGIKEGCAISVQTSRGVMWSWSAQLESHMDFKSRFEVRDIVEKGILVIVFQDGVSNEQGDKLFKLRWEELRLMDYIVDSPEFAAGDYKQSFEAGFKRMDDGVKTMVEELDKSNVDWSEPIMWRACYNTTIVVVAGNQVYMAGGGCFMVKRIAGKEVLNISCPTTGVGPAKFVVGCGYEDMSIEDMRKYVEPWVKYAESQRTDKELYFYDKYELKICDECIVVEQHNPFSRGGGPFWLKHGKNWGAAMTAITEYHMNSPSVQFSAVLLVLEHPKDSAICGSNVAPSPLRAPPPSKAYVSECFTKLAPLKKLSLIHV